MKKVLKLIVLVAVISALTLVAFAASPEVATVENESGAAEIAAVTAEAPEGITVEVVPPTEAAANEAAAKAAQPEATILDSFDINVKDAEGNELHEGATVTVTINVPEEFVGGTLYLYEDGVLAQTVAITSTTVTLVITSFSTYTPVLVKAAAAPGPGPGPVTPQTMQTLLPYALGILAVAAVAVAVIAKKRSFN